VIAGFGSPKVSFFPPLPFSLSPSLSLLLPLLARAPRPSDTPPSARAPPLGPRARDLPGPAPTRPCPAEPAPSRAPTPRSCPGGCALVARPGGRACPRALGRTPPAVPLPTPVPLATRVPRAYTVRVPSARVARSRACDRSRTALNPVLIDVNLCSQRAASRTSSRDDSFNLYLLKCCVALFVTRRIYLISDSINVLCCALRRAMIYFNFMLFKVRRRASRRAMFHFKLSSVDVCRRAFHRAMHNVSY
jgi:hypothetical protein